MYRYETLADKFIQDIITDSKHVVGVTGTSCIGKSMFTKLISSKLQLTCSVTVINVDSYLKEEVRGGTKFWDYSHEYLKPELFDWKTLAYDVKRLKQGESVEIEAYVRGIGWGNTVVLEPADVIVLEGLFLDSVQAAEFVPYDMMIVLSAEDDFIRKLRIDRDNYYRKNFKEFKRTEEETLKEIENTLKAGKSYQVSDSISDYRKLFVEEGFWVTIL